MLRKKLIKALSSITRVTFNMTIFYRSRYYTFEEYLVHWYEKLKTDEPTTMTVRLQKEIEKYKVKTKK